MRSFLMFSTVVKSSVDSVEQEAVMERDRDISWEGVEGVEGLKVPLSRIHWSTAWTYCQSRRLDSCMSLHTCAIILPVSDSIFAPCTLNTSMTECLS